MGYRLYWPVKLCGMLLVLLCGLMLLLLHSVNCCVEFIHRCEDACQHCAFVGGHAVYVVDLIGNCNDTVGCIGSRCWLDDASRRGFNGSCHGFTFGKWSNGDKE